MFLKLVNSKKYVIINVKILGSLAFAYVFHFDPLIYTLRNLSVKQFGSNSEPIHALIKMVSKIISKQHLLPACDELTCL